MQKLKANRTSETEEQRKESLRKGRESDRARRRKKKTQEGKKRSSQTENHEKQCLATLKILKQGDDNELERNLRLEKAVASKQFRLAVETEEEIRARLENDAATKRLRLAMEMDEERKTRLTGEDGSYRTAHLALIKVWSMWVWFLSLKPILKSWQLCLSYKLDVLTTS